MYIDAYAENLIKKCNDRELRFEEEVTGFRFRAKPSEIYCAAYEINKVFNTFGIITVKEILRQFVPESDLLGIPEELLDYGWTATCFDGFEAYWIDFSIHCIDELGDTILVLDYWLESCPTCKTCDGVCTRDWIEINNKEYQRTWLN